MLHDGAQPAHQQWQHLITRHSGAHLGWTAGARRARVLPLGTYAISTQRDDLQAWERFARYCRQEVRRALPAHYTTIPGNIGSLRLRGTIAAGSLGGYLAPISKVHELAGYPSHTALPIFAHLLKCFLQVNAAVQGSLPDSKGPLPATVIQSAPLLGSRQAQVDCWQVASDWFLLYLCLTARALPRRCEHWISPRLAYAFASLPISRPPARARDMLFSFPVTLADTTKIPRCSSSGGTSSSHRRRLPNGTTLSSGGYPPRSSCGGTVAPARPRAAQPPAACQRSLDRPLRP